MPLTQAQIDMIANGALDFYMNSGTAFQQSIQDRPLLAKLESRAKTFPGGKGKITVFVNSAFGAAGVNDSLVGYTADDVVSFYNPANLDKLEFTWREHHIGLTVTHTELKNDGISITNESGATSNHSGRDKTALINLWETKLFDFGERYARSLNLLCWGDGTLDAKALHGIRHFIVADPSVGTVGGKDRSQAANAYLRNRARTAAFGAKVTATPALAAHGGDRVTSSAANGGALITELQKEALMLRRYGAKPDTFLAGSDFIAAYRAEIRANGNYSMNGFKGPQDGAMGEVLFDGTPIVYDPTLDDLGLAKRAYWFDSRHIYLQKMEAEWKKVSNPARPVDKFVLNRSITSTGQMVATQLNGALVIDIA